MNFARLVLLTFVSFAACDSDNERTTTLGEAACSHFADGPIETVTVGASAGAATDVSAAATRYDLTLGAVGAARGGYVKVVVASAGTRTFYFDTAVDVVVTNGGAVVQPLTVRTANGDCATIKAERSYALTAGTYTFALTTNATTDPVLLVWLGTAR